MSNCQCSECDSERHEPEGPAHITTFRAGATGACQHCGLSFLLHIEVDEQGRKDVCTNPYRLPESEPACRCGHPLAPNHQTPGTECSAEDCPCGCYSADKEGTTRC